jgi:hypothetical protein
MNGPVALVLLAWVAGVVAVLAMLLRNRVKPNQRGDLPAASEELVELYGEWISRYPRFWFPSTYFDGSPGRVTDLRTFAGDDPVDASFSVPLGSQPRRVVVVRLPREVPTAVFRKWLPGPLRALAGPGFPALRDERLGRAWSAWAPEESAQSARDDPMLVPVVVLMTWSRMHGQLPEYVRGWASSLPGDLRQHVDRLATNELGLDFSGHWCAVSGNAVSHPDPSVSLEAVARYLPQMFDAA